MKKRIGLLVLAASLMVSQTALAGKWTGTVPTQTRADWAAEYDTPTVGPAADTYHGRFAGSAEWKRADDVFPKRARAGSGCGGRLGESEGWRCGQRQLTGYMAADALTYTEDGIRTLLGRIIAVCVKGRGQGDEGMR